MAVSFWDKIQLLTSNPNKLFREMKGDGIKDVLLFYLLLAVVAVGIASVALIPFIGIGGFFMPVYGVILALVGLVWLFIYSGLVHIVIRLFNGSGTISDTFNVVGICLAISTALGIIPFVGILATIAGIILAVFGLSAIHDISKLQAAIAYIAPGAIIFGMLVMLFFWMLSMW